MASPINYAHAIGFKSVPAAAVFAALYVPLFGWYVLQSIRNPTYVLIVLSLFCAIRITAFVIRAVLASSSTAGQHFGLLIGDQILFGVGFFGLLYSAYTLVLDRELLKGTPPHRSFILRITRNRALFRLALTSAVALGITGTTMSQSSNPQTIKTGLTLRKVGTIIFLVLTVLQAFQTLILAKIELTSKSERKADEHQSFGMKYGIYILYIVSLLLLVRESFSMATVSNTFKQNNEHFWYPLVALPEILVVILFSTPGLVPRRSDLQSNTDKPEA
ncbi:hypothetical protein K443DRAFT_5931 [Laccaria amethystina LaAM-08-1]|uniref:Protein RTA1 n=1 Tax=Laccaria amethystina LaAM-08-1 TaxID=1095629 RepID=A0A0C9WU36_9AGAR|nr:hypothetical protein K443DRAFT_5931 [Laccaria amethystina LaAM-08-1]